MSHCIHCGSYKAERTGDDFHCPDCKFDWDVAHEQENAAYLASQGRKPAKPMKELLVEVEQPEAPETDEGEQSLKPTGKGEQPETPPEDDKPAKPTGKDKK